MKYKIFGILLLFLSISSCKNFGSEEETKQQEVNIIYSDWSEGIAMSFLAKNVLSQELNYKVNLKMAGIEDAYESLATGEYDIMLNAWLPETHAVYFSKHKSKLTDLGPVFKNASTGIVVPAEAKIESIEKLSSYTDTIYGIGSDAGIMIKTQKALESYELNIELWEGQEDKMMEILDKAYKRKEPVAITGWKPHLMFSRYELKFLKDPKKVFPSAESIHALVNTNNITQDKTIMSFLERLNLNEKQLSDLLREMKTNSGNEDRAAQEWMKKNKPIVSKWTQGLKKFEEKPM